ncbi:hypothetical protein DICVIV_09863 [Dictyocaulus viviparus]|uniref:Amino acid permease/ SLC12A domain-containing protein n=1 Tax=Dictyocaulus viviparus TaxID=29172 RepID=A0A0D8XHG4_DICVI|nr:hypothetical protein DICVIV_09863 [Dictyocaulus viviparus]
MPGCGEQHLTVTYCNIIGSGIFITPTSILNYTNSVGLSLIVWIGCGFISLIGAICFIELGTSIPEPGCDFAYAVYVGWHAIAFAFMLISVNGITPLLSIDSEWCLFSGRTMGYTLLGSVAVGVVQLHGDLKMNSEYSIAKAGIGFSSF